MNDDDSWVYFDGPEPERVRVFLDVLRNVLPVRAEDEQRRGSAFFERFHALVGASPEPLASGGLPGPQVAALAMGEPPPRQVAPVAPSSTPAAAVSAPGAAVSAPSPPVVRAPAALTGTGAALDLPAAVWALSGKLPFKRPGESTAPTVQSAGKSRGVGETLPLGDDSLRKALASVVRPPDIDVKTYVMFCAELAVFPERRAEIQRRYEVPNEPSHQELDARWRTRLAAIAWERVFFEANVPAYMEYLRGPRR